MNAGAIDAVLLCGGESRRFGSMKAGVIWRGRSLADHVLAAIPDSCAQTILVLRAPDDPPPVKTDIVTCDAPESPAGPLSGVIAGLRACRSPWAWVLACDIPMVSTDLLTALAEPRRPDDLALLPVWEGRPQPLCALYNTRIVDSLAAATREGVRSLQAALDRVGYREIDEDRIRAVDPHGRSFLNINTPADLDALSGIPTGSTQKPEFRS